MGEVAFKQKLQECEALEIAKRKNDWLWNIVFYRLPLAKLQFMYMEYIMISVKTVSEPSLLQKIRHVEDRKIIKFFKILFNGTTGSVALIVDMPQTEEIEFEDGDIVQKTKFTEDEVISNVRKLAHKLTHRNLGGMHQVEIVDYKSIYRPFWVAYYGEFIEGGKVRYITIPADNGQNTRAR